MMWVPKDNRFCFKNKIKDFISATGFYEVFFDVKKIGTAKGLVPQTGDFQNFASSYPNIFLSSSTLSVFSQGRSISVLPKCP